MRCAETLPHSCVERQDILGASTSSSLNTLGAGDADLRF